MFRAMGAGITCEDLSIRCRALLRTTEQAASNQVHRMTQEVTISQIPFSAIPVLARQENEKVAMCERWGKSTGPEEWAPTY